MTATIDQFKALLAEFEELPRTPQRDPTILEILGYPYSKWENAYSNTLAFFLDPERKHGLGPIFLQSLLSVAECEAIQDSEKVEVNREDIAVLNHSRAKVYWLNLGNWKYFFCRMPLTKRFLICSKQVVHIA